MFFFCFGRSTTELAIEDFCCRFFGMAVTIVDDIDDDDTTTAVLALVIMVLFQLTAAVEDKLL